MIKRRRLVVGSVASILTATAMAPHLEAAASGSVKEQPNSRDSISTQPATMDTPCHPGKKHQHKWDDYKIRRVGKSAGNRTPDYGPNAQSHLNGWHSFAAVEKHGDKLWVDDRWADGCSAMGFVMRMEHLNSRSSCRNKRGAAEGWAVCNFEWPEDDHNYFYILSAGTYEDRSNDLYDDRGASTFFWNDE